jgi:hypothetical protein
VRGSCGFEYLIRTIDQHYIKRMTDATYPFSQVFEAFERQGCDAFGKARVIGKIKAMDPALRMFVDSRACHVTVPMSGWHRPSPGRF